MEQTNIAKLAYIPTEMIKLVLRKKDELPPLTVDEINNKKTAIFLIKEALAGITISELRIILELEQMRRSLDADLLKVLQKFSFDDLKLIIRRKDAQPPLSDEMIEKKKGLIARLKEGLARVGKPDLIKRELIERYLVIFEPKVKVFDISQCSNEHASDVVTEISEIDPKDLVTTVDPRRRDRFRCDHIDILKDYLTSIKKNQDALTFQPIWANKTEFEKQILGHPKLTPEDREELSEIFYPTGFSKAILRLAEENIETYQLIGVVGAILLSDYTKGFEPSLAALARLREHLDGLPAATREAFLNLQIPCHRSSLGKYITERERCIHGVGLNILEIYLCIWFEFPPEKRPPFPNYLVRDRANPYMVYAQIQSIRNISYYSYRHQRDFCKSCRFWHAGHVPEDSKRACLTAHMRLKAKVKELGLPELKPETTGWGDAE